MKQQVWDVEALHSLLFVYPPGKPDYCESFDTIDFLFCHLRNLSGLISVDVVTLPTAKT